MLISTLEVAETIPIALTWALSPLSANVQTITFAPTDVDRGLTRVQGCQDNRIFCLQVQNYFLSKKSVLSLYFQRFYT